MPREIKSKEEFERLVKSASEIRVVKSGDTAKVKLRTKAQLYTFATTAAEADALAKSTKTPVVEF